MPVYEAFRSTAIEKINCGTDDVKITYTSDRNKEYVFTCVDIPQFSDDLSAILIDHTLQKNPTSVGRFVHQKINDKTLVAVPTT